MTPRPLTEQPLARAIFRLAWPAFASMMLLNLFQLVDAFWVGRLGTDALGGMTASAFLVWCFHSAGQLVGMGVNALVARRVGERRPEEAGRAGAHGVVLGLALAGGVMLLGLPARWPVLELMGLGPGSLRAGVDYLTPVLLGFPAVTVWYALDAVFRGSGDTRTPMGILGVSLVFNACLDPVLIFGVGPLPALGISGAAWATVAAHVMGVALGLVLLRPRDVRPTLGGRGLDPEILATLLRVGTPIALTSLLFSVIYILLTPIIAAQGSAAVAAVGVGHRVEGLAYYTCLGFSSAATTLVGQYLGAGRADLASRAAWSATGANAALLVLYSLGFYLFAPWIYALFSADPLVIHKGSEYLRIIAIFETGMALELVLEGAFGGAGDTLPPMLLGVPLTALRVPLAYYLSQVLGWGAPGIWWAISVTTALKGAATALWFSLGRWKTVKL